MSFIIQGIDMPRGTEGMSITFYTKNGWRETHILDVDQAIQIPKDHGDIKDVSGIINHLEDTIREEGLDPWCEVNAVIELIDDAPTILEAERED